MCSLRLLALEVRVAGFCECEELAESLSTFLSQLANLEKIVVTNQTYERYSEQVRSFSLPPNQ